MSAGNAVTMLDQKLFPLACGHSLVVGRLNNADTWECEYCRTVTDLRVEPYKSRLAQDRDIASEIDKQERSRGKTIVRAYGDTNGRSAWTCRRRCSRSPTR